MLEIKDLSVQYGKQAPTIEHFNLSMKKGEIISVVGESGSGKTTVIRAVLGALAGGGRSAPEIFSFTDILCFPIQRMNGEI